MMVIADTTLLIDLQRSDRNERQQQASRWLEEHVDVEIALPAVVLGEFAEGFESAEHPAVRHYRETHRIIPVDEAVAMVYSRVSRELRSTGMSIGANDTWIAATALACGAALVTRNKRHFDRVDGLVLMGYGLDE